MKGAHRTASPAAANRKLTMKRLICAFAGVGVVMGMGLYLNRAKPPTAPPTDPPVEATAEQAPERVPGSIHDPAPSPAAIAEQPSAEQPWGETPYAHQAPNTVAPVVDLALDLNHADDTL